MNDNYPPGVTESDIDNGGCLHDASDCTCECVEFAEWKQWIEDGWYSESILRDFYEDGLSPEDVQSRMAEEIKRESLEDDARTYIE